MNATIETFITGWRDRLAAKLPTAQMQAGGEMILDSLEEAAEDWNFDGNGDDPIWMTVKEVAAYVGVHPQTVWQWINDGHLADNRIPGGWRHRIDQREVDDVMRRKGRAEKTRRALTVARKTEA